MADQCAAMALPQALADDARRQTEDKTKRSHVRLAGDGPGGRPLMTTGTEPAPVARRVPSRPARYDATGSAKRVVNAA